MNTIKLKLEGNLQHYITELSKTDYDKLIAWSKAGDKEKIETYFKFNPDNVVGVGTTHELNIWNLRRYVAYLKGYAPNNRMPERRVAYRDYAITEEAQRKKVWLVNTCEDATTSANSLIRSLKLPFVAIWYHKIK